MSWAAHRRLVILLILGAAITAFIAVILIATFYETPTCTDGKQNQDETGIDCGGSCSLLCAADVLPPTVLFSQTFQSEAGRTDVVAEIENKNATAAARGVAYRVTLYGADQSLIQQVTGIVDLPPRSRVPLFIPNIASGKQAVASSFLDIDSTTLRWFTLLQDPRVVPSVSTPVLKGASSTPRVEATLTNPSAQALSNVRAVVLVFNDAGNVIAASSTVVPTVPAQGQATALFTWNVPFPDPPARVTVTPVIPLP